MKVSAAQLYNLIDMLEARNAWRAVLYLSPHLVARATRRWFKHARSRNSRLEVQLTIGPPNYRERDFIRACRRANQRLPLRQPMLQFKKVK